ncbi:RagB/SusD family nutrient uptake outer membrane protein [Aureibaculum sp. 2210JD6-5]|uniref:RagB/SusD family nutrient uptake outer membrane protein n=1 Tax=Aureibaculum sp. 2210JD6-5 TaxID=3103957 RepID=UPI002AAE2E1E|nr:RagB/SusD family nutrient uptake outer membrane protein [Aureibaculum sp. 2210JD6-5]MDY7395149.1 RagB/SusD family nutrient uptake outer membrane protein [Aureibaculum sp. 2210JD6-5]
MKNKQLIILITLGLFVASCNDDFLDTAPEAQIAKENFFNSESDLQLYINGIHSVPGGGSLFLGDQGTDDMATTGAVEIKNIMVGTPSAETITSGWSWSRLRSINLFLENFGKADVEENVKNHFEGLAKYYRAEFYFDKVKRYSDVPWYSKTLNPDDEDLFKPRDPRAMVVDSIMSDIRFASENIKEDVELGNIHKWAALLLEARIALYEGTFRKYHPELGLEGTANKYLEIAVSAVQELMDSGEFQIYNTGSPTTDYQTLFQSENLVGNSEVILINVYDVEKNRTSGWGTAFGNYEQSPSKALMNTYLMKDGTRFSDKPGYSTLTFVEEFEDRDPRLAQTFVYPGWVRAGSTNAYVQELNKNFTGYHQHKGINNTVESAGDDVAAYRYAEALLIYAEAKAELGTLTQEDLDITVNKLRQRVGLPNLDLGAANTDIDPILESNYPNVSGANKGVILEIRRERRVEFAAEGFRFDDVMRWHAGKILETIPQGMYFPGLGKYDMTGDGVDDIHIIPSSDDIPVPKETNSLGVDLIYYKAGEFGDPAASLLLSNGTSGYMVTSTTPQTFEEPKYYYRPIPAHQVALNPELKQIMGW